MVAARAKALTKGAMAQTELVQSLCLRLAADLTQAVEALEAELDRLIDAEATTRRMAKILVSNPGLVPTALDLRLAPLTDRSDQLWLWQVAQAVLWHPVFAGGIAELRRPTRPRANFARNRDPALASRGRSG